MQFEPFTVAPDANVLTHVSTPWPGAMSTVSVPWQVPGWDTAHPHVQAVAPIVGDPEKIG
jgi:hypothetical protein